MKAMIFAAGLGTRLRPLTNNCPKALVPMNGKPLLEWAILRLKAFGCNELVINIHHFGEQIIDFLASKAHFNMPIHISDERELLLDTGGGLKKARQWLDSDDDFILYNVDILSDIDLTVMYQAHIASKGLATLAIRNRTTSRYLLFHQENKQLVGWTNTKTNEIKVARSTNSPTQQLAFSGIHILSPSIFQYIKEDGPFSIIDLYLRLAQEHTITGYLHDNSTWWDVGKPAQLYAAEEYYKTM